MFSSSNLRFMIYITKKKHHTFSIDGECSLMYNNKYICACFQTQQDVCLILIMAFDMEHLFYINSGD